MVPGGVQSARLLLLDPHSLSSAFVVPMSLFIELAQHPQSLPLPVASSQHYGLPLLPSIPFPRAGRGSLLQPTFSVTVVGDA